MDFEKNEVKIFATIDIPEVIISDYLQILDSDAIKVYLYILFLQKNQIEMDLLNIAKQIGSTIDLVKKAFERLETEGLVIKKNKGYIIKDARELDLNELYTPRLTSSLENATENAGKNINRLKTITTINNSYFQGTMSPTWFTDIDLMFTKYNFNEEVVIALFNECYTKNKLNHGYVKAVAAAWNQNNIHTYDDLENHYIKFEHITDLKKKICKKLGLTRQLTQYEEAYVDKWANDYNFDINIIDQALRSTTAKTNPSFNYIDKILSSWHEKGIKTVDDIKKEKADFKSKESFVKQNSKTTNMNNYTKRSYDNLNKFYDN